MAYNLWEINSSVLNTSDKEQDTRAEALRDAIHQNGLRVQANQDGTFNINSDLDTQIGVLGGAETRNNLQALSSMLNNLRAAAQSVTRSQFRCLIRPYVQEGNRSVESALRNVQQGSVPQMINFMLNFIGKDIKLPIRLLNMAENNTDYGFDPDLAYFEAETGNFHTLQPLGENESIRTYGTYLEDSPLCRRYLRYVDFLAQRCGMRLVYCPKEVNHLDEIAVPVRPTWTIEDGAVVRQIHSDNYRLLYVAFAFNNRMFRNLTMVETEVQPGQRPRRALDMDYTPILVDNLSDVVAVLGNLGSFAACKIYYKDYLNSVRSSQAVQSS